MRRWGDSGFRFSARVAIIREAGRGTGQRVEPRVQVAGVFRCRWVSVLGIKFGKVIPFEASFVLYLAVKKVFGLWSAKISLEDWRDGTRIVDDVLTLLLQHHFAKSCILLWCGSAVDDINLLLYRQIISTR